MPAQYKHNLGTYQGFSEHAPALLNDRLSEFAMSERTVKSGINKLPTNLRTKVNTLLKKAGIDWAKAKTFEYFDTVKRDNHHQSLLLHD
ncbi:hypothetical protein [Pseudoalteromonas sp. MMG005]|uniref:hypothetical protein n=1 Tax=Pseudoalteromonas sp. MMG005 TaxID=2822682 RepID=UPI001B3A7578|nr:hypothetical protein [Pseudoalteromonas sp. MMG005]MBQ4848162.1 hypothetical protein [Pseudoalteromonas sp. MMG005]